MLVAMLLLAEVHRHCLTPFGVARFDMFSRFPGAILAQEFG